MRLVGALRALENDIRLDWCWVWRHMSAARGSWNALRSVLWAIRAPVAPKGPPSPVKCCAHKFLKKERAPLRGHRRYTNKTVLKWWCAWGCIWAQIECAQHGHYKKHGEVRKAHLAIDLRSLGARSAFGDTYVLRTSLKHCPSGLVETPRRGPFRSRCVIV